MLFSGRAPWEPLAADGDVEERAARHGRALAHRELADLEVSAVVHAVDRVAREPLEQPVLQHGQRPAAAFLARLEDEVDGAGEVAGAGEILGRAEQGGGMPVMAAGMHLARHRGAERQVRHLLHRQRVHVRPQADRAVAAPVAQHADHAGPADVAMDLDPPLRQLGGDDVGGAERVEGEFRMRVEIVAQRGQLLGAVVPDGVDDGSIGHGGLLQGRAMTVSPPR